MVSLLHVRLPHFLLKTESALNFGILLTFIVSCLTVHDVVIINDKKWCDHYITDACLWLLAYFVY